jgi:hypothetical protein
MSGAAALMFSVYWPTSQKILARATGTVVLSSNLARRMIDGVFSLPRICNNRLMTETDSATTKSTQTRSSGQFDISTGHANPAAQYVPLVLFKSFINPFMQRSAVSGTVIVHFPIA